MKSDAVVDMSDVIPLRETWSLRTPSAFEGKITVNSVLDVCDMVAWAVPKVTERSEFVVVGKPVPVITIYSPPFLLPDVGVNEVTVNGISEDDRLSELASPIPSK